MKTLLDKYLALNKEFVLNVLSKSLQVKDFWNQIGITPKLRRGRGYEEFEKFFNINLLEATRKNFEKHKAEIKAAQFSKVRICKNQSCKKSFTWNDNPYSDFCSKYCATSFSAKHADPNKISKALKKSKAAKQANRKKRKLCTCKECQKTYFFEKSKNVSRSLCSKRCKHKYMKKIYAKCGGLRRGTSHGKSGWYKGIWCDSSWELAWVIYNLDHNIYFKRNKTGIPYVYKGKQHKYYPDFILQDGTYVEIKGFQYPNWKAKQQQCLVPLKILFEKDLKDIFKYVREKYGSNWIEMYDNSKPIKDISKQRFVWINDGNQNKVITPNELTKYKSNGWILGRIKACRI